MLLNAPEWQTKGQGNKKYWLGLRYAKYGSTGNKTNI